MKYFVALFFLLCSSLVYSQQLDSISVEAKKDVSPVWYYTPMLIPVVPIIVSEAIDGKETDSLNNRVLTDSEKKRYSKENKKERTEQTAIGSIIGIVSALWWIVIL